MKGGNTIEKSGASGKVLVLGGGPAGMAVASSLAKLDHGVHIVERENALGGMLRHIYRVFPLMEDAEKILEEIAGEVRSDPRITVHTGREVEKIVRCSDGYSVTLRQTAVESYPHERPEETISVGAIVASMGLEPVDPAAIMEFGYGRLPGVITSVEMEKLLSSGRLLEMLPDGSSIAFIQCAGSRVMRRGVPYCSSVCCPSAIKNAVIIKELSPSSAVWIFYIDIRAEGRMEEKYREAREAGVRFIRGQPSLIKSKGRRLVVCGENTLLKELYEVEADLVVLQVGLRVSESNRKLLQSIGVKFGADGLPLKGHIRYEDVEQTGVFIAGSLESPRDLRSCLDHACSVAMRVHLYLNHR